MRSKNLEGKKVAIFTKDNFLFEGTFKTINGVEYIVNNKKKTKVKFSEGTLVRNKLKEDESSEDEESKKFSDYFDNTFKQEEYDKVPDKDKINEKIVDEYIKVNQDTTEIDKEKFMGLLAAKNSAKEIEKGNATKDSELEKLKKDDAKQESKIIKRKKVKEDIKLEIETENSDEDLDILKKIGLGIQDADEDDYDISSSFKDESEMDDLEYYDSISDDVDDEVEVALDEVTDGDDVLSKDIVPSLADKFDVDGDKALEESESIPDAILHIAEQIKMKRVQAFREKRRNGRK